MDSLSPTHRHIRAYRTLLDQLTDLLDRMDTQYRHTAARYQFHCDGCDDNCCLTRFYHHTFLEYLLLWEGIAGLAPSMRETVRDRARSYCEKLEKADETEGSVRELCPLNMDGRCVIYPQRPMICRLHGIPHELHHPLRGPSYGPGCEAFDRRCGKRPYIKFDRTPFYAEMAKLEKEFKEAAGIINRIKMNVAEMILTPNLDI